jgi:hypothetical protein
MSSQDPAISRDAFLSKSENVFMLPLRSASVKHSLGGAKMRKNTFCSVALSEPRADIR